MTTRRSADTNMTPLFKRITTPGTRRVVGAISVGGKWGYEKEGFTWVAFLRDSSTASAFVYASSLDAARRRTYEIDHPESVPSAAPTRIEVV